MGAWFDFIFDNAYQVDAQAAEEKIRSKYPLLLHKDEKIELAFTDRGGKGRDKEFFTSHRILIKDGKGVGGKRKNYVSVPYDTIQAFSVQTAGAYLDMDSELNVWSTGYRKVSLDFSKANVDVYQLYQLLNAKVAWSQSRGTADNIDSIPPNMDKKQTTAGNIIDWFGDNAKQVDAKEVETKFKTEFPILLEDEKVEMAFKSGRDTKCFTNKRILMVDVKGLVGKKIEFLTVLYSSIHGFSVQTAGKFLDRDTELRLYTNMIGEKCEINQDFRADKANLWAIQKVLCNHILGDDKDPLPGVDKYEGHVDSQGGLFGIITGLRFDERPIDAVAMDRVLHSDPPILQGSEQVEMAFQGHRDITLFTTKRLITIDKKGLFGKQIEYFSVPWEKIMAFGIRTAGFLIDFDTEVDLYTEMGYFPGESGDGERPPIPARPEQSCL
jgi:sporulation protein YlmC with PRC-barrel domain